MKFYGFINLFVLVFTTRFFKAIHGWMLDNCLFNQLHTSIQSKKRIHRFLFAFFHHKIEISYFSNVYRLIFRLLVSWCTHNVPIFNALNSLRSPNWLTTFNDFRLQWIKCAKLEINASHHLSSNWPRKLSW